MSSKFLEALAKQYEAEIVAGEANIDVYLNNPVGIGEHPDLVESIHTQICKIAEAEERLSVVLRLMDQAD